MLCFVQVFSVFLITFIQTYAHLFGLLLQSQIINNHTRLSVKYSQVTIRKLLTCLSTGNGTLSRDRVLAQTTLFPETSS